jgi:diguanylate cyclase (GGDEF)-like protein/PAS domain S-box-containing protein
MPITRQMDATPVMPLDEASLREAHATLTRILGAIEEYVYTGEFLPDDGYRVVFAGPCREQFLGITVEQARTAIWRYYVHPDDVEIFDTAHDGALRSGRLDTEYRLIGADGVLRWVRDRGRIREQDGRRFLDGSILDVTEMHRIREELVEARAEADRLAHIDHLTGVANRRSLAPVLGQHAGRPVGLLLLDLDHFKAINDEHGHAAGDAVLVAVADRLRTSVRTDDAVVRMGGEEFLVVLRDVADEAQLRAIGENLRERIGSEAIPAGDGLLRVTVSIGAASVAPDDTNFEAGVRRADRALYAAKQDGRDCVRLDLAA